MFNYKKIIKSREMRVKILRLFDFIPDAWMLRLQYFIKTGRSLNIRNPQRYTEKIQWYKLYYKDPLMAQCSDKYEVRKYVEECGLGHILNECYGVFEKVEDIDFNKLPNSFVLKDTLGSGGNDIIIVQDKTKADIQAIKKQLQKWLDRPSTGKHSGREWVYENKKHRILIEKNLLQNGMSDLPDYKFFCFNGKVFCSYLMRNFIFHHDKGELSFFDRDFNLLPVHRNDFSPIMQQPAKPDNYEKLLEYAEVLGKPFPAVRADFYNINNKIIFGELTFFMASGYISFNPDNFDFVLGKQFVLPVKRNKK